MRKSKKGKRRELIAAVVRVRKAPNLKQAEDVSQFGDINFREGLRALRRDRPVKERVATLDIGKPKGREVW